MRTLNSSQPATDSSAFGNRHELGQFLTPPHVADVMASMFYIRDSELEVLDPGAGTGSLTQGLVSRLCKGSNLPKKITVTAFEFDAALVESLRATLKLCEENCSRLGIEFAANVHNEDFIEWAVSALRRDFFSMKVPAFNLAIVNPPYRKLRNDSTARRLLGSIGIETTNLYSAFIALIIRLLSDGGELVAITPRSFCNGVYFRSFRRDLLERMALKQLHLFESRSAAFAKDGVLQENLIIHAVKGDPKPHEVSISLSYGCPNSEISRWLAPYSEVVLSTDPEQFIRISADHQELNSAILARKFQATLSDLGISVSTGRVVDFRAISFLRKELGVDSAPLIYPTHVKNGFVTWPVKNSRKSNALAIHEKTRELLVPSGFYVLVKRFSAKEEPKRITAGVYDPRKVPGQFVGFENHLNYFHIGGRGMAEAVAKGLAVFLNSVLVDKYFRQFSGHTQVNAADLRNINYPTYEQLRTLGEGIGDEMPDQRTIDDLVERLNASRTMHENKVSSPQAL